MVVVVSCHDLALGKEFWEVGIDPNPCGFGCFFVQTLFPQIHLRHRDRISHDVRFCRADYGRFEIVG